MCQLKHVEVEKRLDRGSQKIDALDHGLGAVHPELQISLRLLSSRHEYSVVFSCEIEQGLTIDEMVRFDVDAEIENAVDLTGDQAMAGGGIGADAAIRLEGVAG